MRIDIAVTSAPRTKLLDNPGGETDRRVGERIGERLRLGAHDPGIAALLLEPTIKLPVEALFVRGGLASGHALARNREQRDVDCGEVLRVRIAEPGGNERAPVMAVGRECWNPARLCVHGAPRRNP